MAEGHNISSTNLNEDFQISNSSKSNSVQIQPTSITDTNYNNIKDNLKLSWTGNLESLKYFIEKDIKFNGTWKSPGNERKSCTDGKTTITWWRKKKSIEICGADAENIKQSFCHILLGSHYSTNIKEPLVNNCSCNCLDIATEIEGNSPNKNKADVSEQNYYKLKTTLERVRVKRGNGMAEWRKRKKG